jgi:ankyrin repeat protein
MHYAASAGHIEVLEEFVELGQGLESRATDEDAFTALHYAAAAGQVSGWRGGAHSQLLPRPPNPPPPPPLLQTDTVKWLLKAGADAAAKGVLDFETPLHLAARGKHASTVAALLAGGAPVEVRDRAGRTPLQTAQSVGAAEVVALLEGRR